MVEMAQRIYGAATFGTDQSTQTAWKQILGKKRENLTVNYCLVIVESDVHITS